MTNSKNENRIISVIHGIANAGAWISGIGIVIIMLITGATVVARYFVRRPLQGDMEVTELLLILIGFLVFGYTQIRHGHVSVELLTSRVSKGTGFVLNVLVYFLSAAIYLIMAWAIFQSAWDILKNPFKGTTTTLLGIPETPFLFAAVIGVFILALTLVADLFLSLVEASRK
jgi:TRAP-type C4-dicarboxylate transport system permease small subunit